MANLKQLKPALLLQYGLVEKSSLINYFFVFTKNIFTLKAVAPELENKGGLYLENCRVSTLETDLDKIRSDVFGFVEYALNKESAEKLWILSEKLIKENSQ